jgi:uncharacterized sulfatase
MGVNTYTKHSVSRFLLLAVGFVVANNATTGLAGNAGQPNVVLILSDDQGYADYSFMGHEIIQTPRIDKLAEQSLVYTRGYVTTGVCCPSISTMLTGLYPHQHRTTGNDPLRGTPRSPWISHFRNMPQLPRLMAEQGYLSLCTGKYWHSNPKVSGFTDSMGETGRHGSAYSLSIGRDTMQPIWDFIQKAQDEEKPFMVWYAPFMPHTPHTPPERLEKKYADLGAGSQAKYYAMCEWFDETCGVLLDHLDEKGLTDNTIIMYICDNGWGSYGKGSVKASPYELGVRTPIMIKWPGKVAAKMDKDNLASNLDMLPTVLAACGIDVPDEAEGINLLDHDAVAKRKSLFLENFAHDMLDVDDPVAPLRARSVVSKDWKLTIWREPHPSMATMVWQMDIPEVKTELFDLRNDPLDRNNLAEQNPEKVKELTKILAAWWNPVALSAGDAGLPIKHFVYRSVDGSELNMKFTYPPEWKPGGEKLPAAVMFFGGGWHSGAISQFNDIAPHLAKQGMIVISPEYRTIGTHGVKPAQCLEDAKAAMRYIYKNADRFGIDASRVAAGGRSAGGQLAAATALCDGFNAADDDLSINCKPSALILFNPVIDNGPGGFGQYWVKDCWQQFSPMHNIDAEAPPTIFITGDQDQYTPIETAEKYKKVMEEQGGRCDLVVHKDGVHGSPFGTPYYQRTLDEMDRFLGEIGYLGAKK